MRWAGRTRDVELEPSLYAADFARLGEQVATLLGAGARIFHFDVGDGHFVEPITMGPVVLASISERIHADGGLIDCHLMVESPERHFAAIARAGGDSVTFHFEAVADVAAGVAAAREHGLGVGLAFKPSTPIEAAVEAAADVDLVLCMSIEPGYSGQRFLPGSLERIARTRELAAPEVRVQVDGGIDGDNVRVVRDAGATLIVSASAIFGEPDLAVAYRRLLGALG